MILVLMNIWKMMKYQIIKKTDNEKIMVVSTDISLYNLVINPSKNAARANTGISPIIIFTPSFAPCLKAWILFIVPGNKKLFPITTPAAPAMIIAVNSSVP